MSAELGWAVKNGDLDKVKDFIESKASFILKNKIFPFISSYISCYLFWDSECMLRHVTFTLWEDVNFDSIK